MKYSDWLNVLCARVQVQDVHKLCGRGKQVYCARARWLRSRVARRSDFTEICSLPRYTR